MEPKDQFETLVLTKLLITITRAAKATTSGHNKWICGFVWCMYAWERLHVQGRRISGSARHRQNITLGESLVTIPSALVREIWDEKWQLSRPGPLYLNLFLEIYF